MKILYLIFLIFGLQTLLFAKEEKSDLLFSVEVEKVDEYTVRSRLGKLTEQGKNMGLEGLVLEGKKEVISQDGNLKEVKIIWGKVLLNDKEEVFENPFVSSIEVEGDIEIGDEFSARGNPQELVNKFDKLKVKSFANTNSEEEGDLADAINLEDSSTYFATGGGASDYSAQIQDDSSETDASPVSPNFEVTAEQETKEGCTKVVDKQNMMIHVQTKMIKNGKEVRGCKNSSKSYQLVKEYEKCSAHVDIAGEKIFKRYRIIYKNPDNGDYPIEVEGCQIDPALKENLVRDYKSCGVRHDIAKKKSFSRYRLIYQNGDKDVIFQDCVDDAKIAFDHYKDNSSCEVKFSDGKVIYHDRTAYKEADGKVKYINECTPSENEYKRYDEICSNNKYTHDFAGGQSFVNKNYFYFYDGKRVDISSCIKSDTVLPHKHDISVCNPVFDDSAQTSILMAKPYIEDASIEGGKVFISECREVGTPIEYTKTSFKWEKISSETEQIVSLSAEEKRVNQAHLWGSGFLDLARLKGSIWTIYWSGTACSSLMARYNVTTCGNSVGAYDGVGLTTTRFGNNQGTFYDKRVSDMNNKPWMTTKGHTIDKGLSNQKPTITVSVRELSKCGLCRTNFTTANNANFANTNHKVGAGIWSGDYHWHYYNGHDYYAKYLLTSPTATCLVTKLQKYQIYQRYDGTEYVDKSTVLETKHVCGTGSKLIGNS